MQVTFLWLSRRVLVAFLVLFAIIAWRVEAVGGQLNLTWTDSSSNELGFAIERSTGTTGAFAEITRTGANVTSYTDSNVADATTYCYRLRAFNAAGYSDYSNMSCRTTAQLFGLAVVKMGTGSGTITSAPAGIVCGAMCSATYPSGTTVTLAVTPAAGSVFSGWSGGGCSSTGTCTVTMTAITTVIASFEAFTSTTIDETAPTIAITMPTSGATYTTNTNPLALSGTAADDVGVTEVSWASDRGGSGTAAGTTNWSASGIALQPGANVLTITARDAAGNTGTVTLTVTYHAAALTVSITTPTNDATVSGTTTITASASDNIDVLGVQFVLDGAALGGEQTGPFSLSWDTTWVANGSHTLSAWARDAAGNIAMAADVPVTVNNGQLPGLVAAYAFNEGSGTTVADLSGNNNTGTLSGATWTTQGRFGNALVFDGSSHVTVPDAVSLDLTTGMTLEAWIYPTATPTGWSTAIMKEQPGEFVYALYAGSPITNPYVYFNVSTSPDGERGVAAPSPLPLNTWSHLAGTYDGTTLRFYVNGTLVSSQAFSGPIATSTGSLGIGGNTVWGEYFQGLIDEVRIYNRALSTAEIQQDMDTPL